jgi:tetratricopeptide (TPR) repeat protein
VDHDKTCFVVMPFGKKGVVDENGTPRTVDFDDIYEAIFQRAAAVVRMPAAEGGGVLQVRRTDKDFFAGNISVEMFHYLEYSRIALVDITGLNPNVFYELGVRHRARQAGTVIFRQVAAPIPFDIKQIKAFPYEYDPEERAAEARTLITRVLTESLEQNRPDSPVRAALAVQRTEHVEIEDRLRQAENALRAGDPPRAISLYRNALGDDPNNQLLHFRLGLLLKDEGQWKEALEEFDRTVGCAPGYAEAHREKGIAENKLFHAAKRPVGAADGRTSLERAVGLAPADFDAWASLGGVLKREGLLAEALKAYERSAEASSGHPYPLLNAVTLRAVLDHTLELSEERRKQLRRAERSLRVQVASNPPYDAPWTFFDLAQIRLYGGDAAQFLDFARRGAETAIQAWKIHTFVDSLRLLVKGGLEPTGIHDGIAMLESEAKLLD